MRRYKVSLITALALGSLLACASLSSAQDANANQGKRRGGGMTPQARAERLATDLKLTDAQKTKVTALYEDSAKKMRELRADTSVPREQVRQKAQTIREEDNKKLKAILTPEQWDKYEKQREQFRSRAQKQADEKKSEKKSE